MGVLEVGRSVLDLSIRAGRFWAVTIVGGVLGLVAAAERVLGPAPEGLEWLVDALSAIWLPILLLGIPIAVMAAYHDLRLREADAVRQAHRPKDQRSTTIRQTRTKTEVSSEGLSVAAHERVVQTLLRGQTGSVEGTTVGQDFSADDETG